MSIQELNDDRKKLQVKLATLSARGKVVTLKDAGREIQLYQPGIVATAIREVVQASGTRAPLN